MPKLDPTRPAIQTSSKSIAEVLAEASDDDLILDHPPATRLVCEACGKDYPHIHLVRNGKS